jgi:hypothetical protein
MTFRRGALAMALVALVAAACSSSSSGGSAPGASDGGSSGQSSEGGARVVDCGVHASLGSCGPIEDNCYCAGSTCHNPSSGVYTCIFSCTNDAQCDFVALGTHYAFCTHFTDGQGFCAPAYDGGGATSGGSTSSSSSSSSSSGSSGGGSSSSSSSSSSGGGGGGG